jgi:purine nucleosidase
VQQRMAGLGSLATDLLLPALEQYKSVREPAGPPVHDVCAVAYVAQPDLFGLRAASVQVETTGVLTAGMTVTDFAVPGGAGDGNALVAMDIDVDRFWEVTLATYGRVAGQVPA